MNCLWYTEAAKSWIEALPLGNGRMGAMISGEPFCGQIQMNEESIVYGGPLDRINPDAAKYFPEIRNWCWKERSGKLRNWNFLHCLEHLRANGRIRPCVM